MTHETIEAGPALTVRPVHRGRTTRYTVWCPEHVLLERVEHGSQRQALLFAVAHDAGVHDDKCSTINVDSTSKRVGRRRTVRK